MNLHNHAMSIKDGIPYDVVIASLLDEAKKKGGKADLYREVLQTLYYRVRKARAKGLDTTYTHTWLSVISGTAKEWKVKNQDIIGMLTAFNLLDKTKSGALTNTDITKVYARLVDTENTDTPNSEEALDAYISTNKRTPSTERLRIPSSISKRIKSRREKKKKNNG